MARAGRGKRLFDVRTKNHVSYLSFSVHGRIILACKKCAKSEQIQEDYFLFLIGNLVGCDSLFILVLKIRTSYMSEFRHNVIILVLSNFFYLTSKTFQRSKKSTMVKFSQWWIDS